MAQSTDRLTIHIGYITNDGTKEYETEKTTKVVKCVQACKFIGNSIEFHSDADEFSIDLPLYNITYFSLFYDTLFGFVIFYRAVHFRLFWFVQKSNYIYVFCHFNLW